MADAAAEPTVEASSSNPPPPAGEDGAAPSKKGAKKAEAKAKKEAEKARRAAERKAAEEAQKTAGGGAAEDLATENYGDINPKTKVDAERIHLKDIGAESVGKVVKLRAWIQNSRMQGAKMCFVELREERNWAVQGVIAASAEGKPVSKQMVKWIGGLKLETFVLVEATVEKPLEPVKSCRVSDFELHITKCYCIAPGPEVLGMGLQVSNRPVSSFDDEEEDKAVEEVTAGVEGMNIDATPSASMATHLNNPVMHKRAPVQQAIADVRMWTRKLFSEYLDSQGFVQFEPPCLIGAASEGGANVFQLPYFEKSAFLAQSPQFYKQIEIAGGRKRVYCIGPVFRAENSNTPRHMTEVCISVKRTNPKEHTDKATSSPVSIWKWKSRTTTTRSATCSKASSSTSSAASKRNVPSKSRPSEPSTPAKSSSSRNLARKSASPSPKARSSSARKAPRSSAP
jgi:aspartyl-tRNA synthetase